MWGFCRWYMLYTCTGCCEHTRQGRTQRVAGEVLGKSPRVAGEGDHAMLCPCSHRATNACCFLGSACAGAPSVHALTTSFHYCTAVLQCYRRNRLTDAEITSNLLLVLLAGHDTSSTTLTRCLSNLHDQPWVMEKLRAEQQAVQAKRGQQITTGALKDMPFADAVIRCVVWQDLLLCTVGISGPRCRLGNWGSTSRQSGCLLPLFALFQCSFSTCFVRQMLHRVPLRQPPAAANAGR